MIYILNDNLSLIVAIHYQLRHVCLHCYYPLGDDPLGTYHTFYAYRSDDHVKQIVLPNGEALDFDYHTQGALNDVSSDHWDMGTITEVEYLKETQYDEAGRVVECTIGNDVVQAYDYNPWTTQGGRLVVARILGAI